MNTKEGVVEILGEIKTFSTAPSPTTPEEFTAQEMKKAFIKVKAQMLVDEDPTMYQYLKEFIPGLIKPILSKDAKICIIRILLNLLGLSFCLGVPLTFHIYGMNEVACHISIFSVILSVVWTVYCWGALKVLGKGGISIPQF